MRKKNHRLNKSIEKEFKDSEKNSNLVEKENKINNLPIQNNWKHLINFEPKTEAGRQLCELIRKNNNPHD